MMCERSECKNRRSDKAKYCGSKCRKLAFKEKHGPEAPKVTGKATSKPLPQAKKPTGTDTNVATKIKGCGHIIPAAGRCLQKGCYGVLKSKKDVS